MTTFSPMMIPLPTACGDLPLWDARANLRAQLAEGEMAHCPCCGQTAKVYSRAITGTMVRSLQAIARAGFMGLDNRQIIAATKQSGGGNTSLLAHWKVIRNDKRRWVATSDGFAFLRNEFRVPSRILLYDNIFLGFDTSEYVKASDLWDAPWERESMMAPEAVTEAEVEPAG